MRNKTWKTFLRESLELNEPGNKSIKFELGILLLNETAERLVVLEAQLCPVTVTERHTE